MANDRQTPEVSLGIGEEWPNHRQRFTLEVTPTQYQVIRRIRNAYNIGRVPRVGLINPLCLKGSEHQLTLPDSKQTNKIFLFFNAADDPNAFIKDVNDFIKGRI